MSAISTIFDTISTFLGSTFPGHKILVNPWSLEMNDNLSLNQGIGFYLGAGFNTKRIVGCQKSISRELVVKICRVQKGTDRDYSIRNETEKLLLEDQSTLVSLLENDPTVSDLVSKIEWDSDNGIEFVYPDRISYLFIEMRFTIEYLENI